MEAPQSPARLRVLLVDDSLVVRRMLERMLGREPDIEVIGTCSGGAEGVRQIRALRPDVVVLDVEMPDMDGLGVVRAVRTENKDVAIIMFSTLTDRGAAVAIEALGLGASDYALKPSAAAASGDAGEQVRKELVSRIRIHGRRRLPARPRPMTTCALRPALPASKPAILAIGCSTGGPNALAELFGALPAPLPIPIVVVQHMPPIFTRLLAERLGRVSKIPTVEAGEGQSLEAGRAYIAPGGKHLVLARGGSGVRVALNEDPPVNFCRPSVDPMLRSVAELYGRGALALILTGMGEDGLTGARAVRLAGGTVLAQDQESSVVWGMPGAVVKAGVAEQSLSLEHMAQEVLRRSGPLLRRVGA